MLFELEKEPRMKFRAANEMSGGLSLILQRYFWYLSSK